MILEYRLPLRLGVITLSDSVLDKLWSHRQHRRFSSEAGGQLFARIVAGRLDIEEITGPRQTDRRSLFGYEPDRSAERAEIKAQFRRGLHFVGDWHTHRQAIPTPSYVDLENVREIVTKSEHDLPGILMVIAGTARPPAGLHVSFHSPTNDYVLVFTQLAIP